MLQIILSFAYFCAVNSGHTATIFSNGKVTFKYLNVVLKGKVTFQETHSFT